MKITNIINKKSIAYAAALFAFTFSGCKDLLNEQPRAGPTPDHIRRVSV